MTPTDELRVQLRALLNESIPSGGADSDTRFSDDEIDAFLEVSSSINEAAWHGWVAKATRVFEEDGGVLEKRVGSEVLKLISPKDKAEFAWGMAGYYENLIPVEAGGGSRLFEFEPPPELSFVVPATEQDLSRLIGHFEVE